MRIRTAPGLSQRLRDEPSSRGEFLVFVSRVFAPAPGSAARIRVANMNDPTPFKKPQGRATRCWSSLVFVSRVFAPAPGSAAKFWNKPIKDSHDFPHYGDRPPCRRSPTATRLFAPTGRFSLAWGQRGFASATLRTENEHHHQGRTGRRRPAARTVRR
jgi:hypothetical protein